MKKQFLLILLSLISIFTNGQILRIATNPSTIGSQIPGYTQVISINTKTFSYTPSAIPATPAPVDNDTTTEDDKRYRYADIINANISMADGNITSTTIGKVWTLRVSIPSALNIGLLFNQFSLSATAEMYIFNDVRTVLDSAIKKANFVAANTLATGPIKGNAVIVYIVEPNNFGSLQSSIAMQQAEAGFQNIADVGDDDVAQTNGMATINCDPFIKCQQDKMPYARAVARFFCNGHSGTGTLINNESNDGKAYFLTAFHILDNAGSPVGGPNGILEPAEIAALSESIFDFQFWKINCGGSINNKAIDFYGATLLAASNASDFVLLQLTDPPGIGDGVNYAGWNRQTSAPANYNSFIIHHPQTQDMRITNTQNVSTYLLNSNFWSAHYYSGTVDKGSSGSALMNPNGQIVGQLRSGWSSCDFTDFGDRYGKLDKSWTGGGTNNTRLSNWLSPVQTLQATNLLNLTDIPITGPSIVACTTPTQYSTLPGLLDVTYTWVVSAGLQILSGQGTATVSISGLPNNQYGSGTLTLTLNSPTKGLLKTLTVSKSITISTGAGGNITGTYNSPTNPAEQLIPTPKKVLNFEGNAACIAFITNMNIPAGSTVSWAANNLSSNDIGWSQGSKDIFCSFTAVGQTADFTITVTNSCGSYTQSYRFKCSTTNSCGISPYIVILSPNPSSSSMKVSLQQINVNADKKVIKEIRIINKSGINKMIKKYGNNERLINLDISSLTPDVYSIMVFDGKKWVTEKFIKQ